MMDMAAATTVDNNNAVDNINSAVSYSTDAQSVQSGVTQPHSPARTSVTPLSLSPASHSKTTNQSVDNTIGTMEIMPQYRSQHNQKQEDLSLGAILDQQQQQEALNLSYQQNRQRSNPVSDDDETEPSSSVNTRENNTTATVNNNGTDEKGYTRSDIYTGATSTFGRLVKSAAKTINARNPATNTENTDNTDRKESADEEGVIEGVLIYGYLQKLNRNGKWQTRWFETDGECLTYFKSSKRIKLLASLDLAKVGSITVNTEDENGCGFTISIAKRPYHLRADSKTAMNDWVITLNRVKEARMQEGNVKLVMPNDFQKNQPPIDLLDDQNFTTPRVVVVANRQRTHALEDDFHSWEAGCAMDEDNPFNDMSQNSTSHSSAARWQKPKNSLSHLASKVLRWARSLKQYHCFTDAENQVIILNPNLSAEPSTIAATKSVSSNQSPKNVVNTVPTADLLDTGGIDSMNSTSVLPKNKQNNNGGGGRQPIVDVDDDDDENAARFLS
mmetsp:Transcript_8389/g.20730  ORF Transcript_8389/g.20730 Transcript_8389/m.20730 type:complete len:501 (-) Transcript_8389:558-2060(-)